MMKKLPNSQTLWEDARKPEEKLNCEGVMMNFTSGVVVCRSAFRRDLEDMEDARALLIDVERQRLGRSRLWDEWLILRSRI